MSYSSTIVSLLMAVNLLHIAMGRKRFGIKGNSWTSSPEQSEGISILLCIIVAVIIFLVIFGLCLVYVYVKWPNTRMTRLGTENSTAIDQRFQTNSMKNPPILSSYSPSKRELRRYDECGSGRNFQQTRPFSVIEVEPRQLPNRDYYH